MKQKHQNYSLVTDLPCLVIIMKTQIDTEQYYLMIAQLLIWLFCLLCYTYAKRREASRFTRNLILVSYFGKILSLSLCNRQEIYLYEITVIVQYIVLLGKNEQHTKRLCLFVSIVNVYQSIEELHFWLTVGIIQIVLCFYFIEFNHSNYQEIENNQLTESLGSEHMSLDDCLKKIHWLKNEKFIVYSLRQSHYHPNQELIQFLKNYSQGEDLIQQFLKSRILINSVLHEMETIIQNIISGEQVQQYISGPITNPSFQFTNHQINIFVVNDFDHFIVIHLQDTSQQIDSNHLIDICKSLSHEFGTSLNCISNLAEIALDLQEVENEIKKQYLQPILINCQQLQLIISNIRDYGAVKTNTFQSNLQVFNVKTQVETVLQLFQETCTQKQIEIELEQQDLYMEIVNDKNVVTQIFYQLMSNAVRYTCNGQITIKLKVRDDFVKITVHDTGIGMNAEEQLNLAQLLQTNSLTRVSKQSVGSGLGLVVSNLLLKQINQNQSDSVTYNGQDGTKFKFRIKNMQHTVLQIIDQSPKTIKCKSILRISNTAYIENIHQQSGQFDARMFMTNNYLGSSITIMKPINQHNHLSQQKYKFIIKEASIYNKCCSNVLIVDDEYFNILVLRTILSKYHINSDCAYNGCDAIQQLNKRLQTPCSVCENKYYTLIFLDINMPMMDGFETVKKIKSMVQDKIIKECKCIANTAFTDLETRVQAYDAGMDYFTTKPLQKERIYEIINDLHPRDSLANI